MKLSEVMNYFKKILLVVLLAYSQLALSGTTTEVSTLAELKSLAPVAGDTIVLVGADWANSQVELKGTGTEQNPIVYRVAVPQKTIFSKGATLRISGQWIVADGFIFKDGFSVGPDIITFTKESTHCTLMNSAVLEYNPPQRETDYKWLSMFGKHNTVINCEFTGKTHRGTTLVVWMDEQPNHHKILNNYFGPRPDLGENGGETIRIGTSHWSMYSSCTLVRGNTFDRCDGEIEVISVKSCQNILEQNLFFECAGTLTLRHGNDNIVRNNQFLGNGKANTGGIRIIGERQQVHHNYMFKLRGRGLRAAVSVMNGVENPVLNSYFAVKEANIEANVIVDCTEGVVIGAGTNTVRTEVPSGLSIKRNTFQNVAAPILFLDTPIALEMESNQIASYR